MSDRKRSAADPAGADKRVKPVVDLVPKTADSPVATEVVAVEPVEVEPVEAEPVETEEADDEADQALADIDPATDEELDAIARDIGKRAPAGPYSS